MTGVEGENPQKKTFLKESCREVSSKVFGPRGLRSGGRSPGGHWGALTFLWSGGKGECWGPKRSEFRLLRTQGAWFLDKPAATREKRSVAVYIYIYATTPPNVYLFGLFACFYLLLPCSWEQT